MINLKINNQHAFTIIELLVCSFISLLITGLLLQTVLANQKLYKLDIVRTSMEQNLKTAMEIIGATVREAGENLPPTFPSVELIQDKNGFSEIIVRRNLLDEILKVCEPIVAGNLTNNIFFAIAGTISGCIYNDNTYNYNAWKQYREDQNGNVFPYIYDPDTSVGEFFSYKSETDGGSSYALVTNNKIFSNSYQVGSSAIYMVEEWRFFIKDGFLVLVENGQVEEKKIINNVSQFKISIDMNDETTKDSFLPENNDMWIDIDSIDIKLAVKDKFLDKSFEKTLEGNFYPRNILSN